jgi:alpha-ketoglutarate-dependent taurine dioxygenase
MTIVVHPSPSQPYTIMVAENKVSSLSVEDNKIISLYKKHGAVLLRGFEFDLKEFKRFTERFCSASVFNESPDRLLIDEASNIQTVNTGPDPFPLHPELSRDPWKPDVCFFWCMNPANQGGETLICDGIDVVRHMPPEVFHALEPRRLLYAQLAHPEHCDYWLGTATPDNAALQNPPDDCPYRFFRAGDQIVRAFSRPALHTPMFSTDLAFGNFLLFARYQLGITSFPVFENREIVPDCLVADVRRISDAAAVPVRWQKGDLLMLDNTRFMHGRNAIVGAEERQIAAYFGYLKFALPGIEEPPDARWRRPGFRAPHKTTDSH